MARLRAVVTLPWTTALPEDVTINTFHFVTGTTPASGADIDSIEDNLTAFYNVEGGPGATPVAWYLSALLSRAAGAASIETFNIDDPEPRQPVGLRTFQLGAAGVANSLPPEVACCLSMQAVPVSGIPQARRRGRVFIGPVNSGAADATTGRPLAAFMTQLAENASQLLIDSQADNVVWSVYSRVGDAMSAVENGWIDNSWDTQRRRNLAASSRTLWSNLIP